MINPQAPMWIDYIAFYTRKPAPAPVRILRVLGCKAAIRLADRHIWRDGKHIIREQWSHTIYDYAGEQYGFILLRGKHGMIGRKLDDVRFVEGKAA